jgi:hypothetical protein
VPINLTIYEMMFIIVASQKIFFTNMKNGRAQFGSYFPIHGSFPDFTRLRNPTSSAHSAIGDVVTLTECGGSHIFALFLRHQQKHNLFAGQRGLSRSSEFEPTVRWCHRMRQMAVCVFASELFAHLFFTTFFSETFSSHLHLPMDGEKWGRSFGGMREAAVRWS